MKHINHIIETFFAIHAKLYSKKVLKRRKTQFTYKKNAIFIFIIIPLYEKNVKKFGINNDLDAAVSGNCVVR